MLTVVSYQIVAAVQCRWVALLRLEDLSLDFRIAAASKNNIVNMASALGFLARLSVLRSNSQLTTFVSRPGRTVTPARTAVCSSSGAILPKPKKVSAARQLTVVGVNLWRCCHQVIETLLVPAAHQPVNVFPLALLEVV